MMGRTVVARAVAVVLKQQQADEDAYKSEEEEDPFLWLLLLLLCSGETAGILQCATQMNTAKNKRRNTKFEKKN